MIRTVQHGPEKEKDIPTMRPERPTPAQLRLTVQAAFALICLFVGWRFAAFTAWATGASQTFVPRPPSVEAFLPISAFMAAKRLLATGAWDMIHPAGLTILLAACALALVFRKGFCGHVCPVGLVHNLLDRAARRLHTRRTLPRRAALALTAVKYATLGFFVNVVWLQMDAAAIGQFLRAPYNLAADASMLRFFQHPSATALAVLVALAALALVVPYFWCRFLCPYGALLGLIALASPLAIRRDPETCTQCGRCTRACPGGIRVQDKLRVNTPECIGCMQCTGACPVPDCLQPTLPGRRRVHFALAALGCVALLAAAIAWAQATGHWQTTLPPELLARFYRMAL